MNETAPEGAPIEPGPAAQAGPVTAKKVRFRRSRALLSKIPHPPLHSKRGVFALVAGTTLVVGGVVGGVMWFVPYSESIAFCTTCHTMIPQHKAFEASAHAEVPCGDCHVGPGISGWVKAKLAGTQELKALILNNYPTPIPAIEHSALPSTEDTCMECHSLDRINTPGNPIKLILRPRYELDEQNTMQMVAVAIRPTGLGSSRSADVETAQIDASKVETSAGDVATLNPRGVHWHVAEPVALFSEDEHLQTIPLVEYTTPDGSVESFIQASEIGLPTNVEPDIQRVKNETEERTMDCIDCHNRVGHNIPDVPASVDAAMAEGTISPDLPFIKKEAVEVIDSLYPSTEAADQAIDTFEKSYAVRYPLAVTGNPGALSEATEEIRAIYHETSTPAMDTNSQTYADNLGHQRGPGCFRCHDGAHVKVVDGVATDQVIPSTCSTCHTFPQVGQNISGLQLGVPPESHASNLYVFNHKDTVASVDEPFQPDAPASANCATCHQQSYCENCHDSGAINVTHDEMLYNHAESVRNASVDACAYCHQPVYCETCHTNDNVMDGATSSPSTELAQVRLTSE